MFVLWAAIRIFVGYVLLTDRIPDGVFNLLWYNTTGYFSRSVPDPDKRYLRWHIWISLQSRRQALQAPLWGLIQTHCSLPQKQPFKRRCRLLRARRR